MSDQPFLERKNEGPAVKGLQTRLKKLGFDPGPLDGEFGEHTEDAVIAFQRAHHLTVDGQVGTETWTAIEAAEHRPHTALTPKLFAERVARVAQGQYSKYHAYTEGQTTLRNQIKRYYRDRGLVFTSSTGQPWSGAFISWCVGEAGATDSEFGFSARHSDYVHRAILNRDKKEGVFYGVPYNTTALKVGDILHRNRPGGRIGFRYARTTDGGYDSHSAIVVEVSGAHAWTVGGNEGAGVVGRTRITLDEHGIAQQDTHARLIAIVRRVH